MRSHIQVMEMSFSQRVACLSLRDREVQSFWKESEQIHCSFKSKGGGLVICLGCLLAEVLLGGGPRVDPGHAGKIISFGWPRHAPCVPPDELEEVASVRELWLSLLGLPP